MKTKAITLAFLVFACLATVNADDNAVDNAYKTAHNAWLKARGDYHDYVANHFPAGIEQTEKIEACKKEMAEAKTKLILADPQLKALYDAKLKAQETYTAQKDRHSKNSLTTARRVLESAWKKSDASKSETITALKAQMRGLGWRQIYIDARNTDPKAKELWRLVEETGKAKKAAKTAEN